VGEDISPQPAAFQRDSSAAVGPGQGRKAVNLPMRARPKSSRTIARPTGA